MSFVMQLRRSAAWGMLAWCAAVPGHAQTWFEIDRAGPPAGQVEGGETLTEVDLDTLVQEATHHTIVVRVSWSQPRLVSGATARSLLARTQISCPTMMVSWSQPRFFTERQAQGEELPLEPETARAAKAVDWLPLGGQAKLVKSACGRLPFRGP